MPMRNWVVLLVLLFCGCVGGSALQKQESASPSPSISSWMTSAAELIIDNTETALVTLNGVWNTLTNSKAYQSSYYWGTSSDASVVFQLPVEAGFFFVYIYYFAASNRDTAVPVSVFTGFNTQQFTVNMQVNGSQWVQLGDSFLTFSGAGTLTISRTGTSQVVIADAVRVVNAATPTRSPSPSRSNSPSVSPTPSRSATATMSRSVSNTPSPTGSKSASPSASVSASASVSSTRSASSSVSPTASPSATVSPTNSPSASVSPSRTPSASVTPSPSPSISNWLLSPRELIIDDTESALVVFTGPWVQSSAATAYNGFYRWGVGTGSAVFQLPVEAGMFFVDIWYVSNPSFSETVSVVVFDGTASSGFSVNMTTGGGQWLRLSESAFTFSGQGSLTIERTATSLVVADAVRIVNAVSVTPTSSVTATNSMSATVSASATRSPTTSPSATSSRSATPSRSSTASPSATASVSPSPSVSISNWVLAPRHLIIDNTETSLLSTTETWNTASNAAGYQTTYLWGAGGSGTVTFTLPVEPGMYYVSMWFYAHPTRSNAVPVSVFDGSATTQFSVNMQINGSQWVQLGSTAFTFSGPGSLTISRAGTSGSVIADAIRIENAVSVSPSASVSATASMSSTSSASRTASSSMSATASMSPTASKSGTPSTSSTASVSGSATASRSATASPSRSATSSRSATPSVSRTATRSRSATSSVSATKSRSTTASQSATPSKTSSASVAASASKSQTTSPSRTRSASVSRSATVSASFALSPSPSPAAFEQIVSSTDSMQTIKVGTWHLLTNSNAFGGGSYYYGSAQYGAVSFEFELEVPVQGVFEVFIWYYQHPNRDTHVPVTVTTSDGSSTTVYVDMTANGNNWFSLGKFSLDTLSTVVVSTEGTTGVVVADSVRAVLTTERIFLNTDTTLVTVVGTWATFSNTNAYSSTYLVGYPNTDTYVEFALPLAAGTYEVYVWYFAHSNRASNAPVTVWTSATTPNRFTLDMRVYGSQWLKLGMFVFGGPNSGSRVVIATTGTDGFVIADAIRTVFVSAASPTPSVTPPASASPSTLPYEACPCTGCVLDTWGECRHNNDGTCVEIGAEGCWAGTTPCPCSGSYTYSSSKSITRSVSLSPSPSPTVGTSPSVLVVPSGEIRVSITSQGKPTGSYVNDNPIQFTFTVSTAGTDFNLFDIRRINCVNPVFTSADPVFYLSCSASQGNEVAVEVMPGTFVYPGAWIWNTGDVYYGVMSDIVAPTFSLSIPDTGGYSSRCSSANPLQLTLTASESLLGLDSSDISVTNCADGSIAVVSTTQAVVTCPANGNNGVNITVSVAAGSVTDRAGTPLQAQFSQSAISDTVNPTISISSHYGDWGVTSDDPITFTFSLSEETNFNLADVTTLQGCINPVFSGSGQTFYITCDGNPYSYVAVGVGAHDIQDCAGNINLAGVPYFAVYSVPGQLQCVSDAQVSGSITVSGTQFTADCVNCQGWANFTFASSGTLWAKTRCPDGSSDSWFVNGVMWPIHWSQSEFVWNEFGAVSAGTVAFSPREPNCAISAVFVGSTEPASTLSCS